MACSAPGTSASTSAASDRLQGSTWTRPPSFAASASRTSRRVPEIATVAPCACRACAIAPPMPPVAPVTSAVLPVKSNINVSSGRQRILCRGEIARPAHGNADRAVGNALDEAAQHFAGADLKEAADAMACHVGDRLAPAHGPGYLLHQAAADLLGILNG